MTTKGRSFRRWRWIAAAAQAVVVLGLPFVSVGGESALRLDVPGGRLLAFGATFAIDEAFVVLAATLLFTAAFLLVTVLFGRVWCGWACPQTVLGELTGLALARGRGGRPRSVADGSGWRVAGALALVAAVSAVVSADLLWFFVSPYQFFRRLAAGALGPVLPAAWTVVGAIVFLDLAFVRETFCRTVCPYAKLQGVLFDRSTLVVAYDARRDPDCVDCGACVRACPTGIDIRHGLQAECIACAACIDACQPMMARLGRAPDLVGYFHGAPGARRRLVRPATVALGIATLAAAALVAAVVEQRTIVGMTALAEDAFLPRRGEDGRVVNAFQVALENHGRTPVTVALSLRVGRTAGQASVRPERLGLEPGERRQLRVVASARGLAPGRSAAALEAEVRSGDRIVERQAQDVPFVVPEAP